MKTGVWVLTIALMCATVGHECAGASNRGKPTPEREKSVRTKTNAATNLHRIPFSQLQQDELTDERGNYLSNRITSPLQHTVIRQESPKGPKYREVIGYTYLLYSMKFPSVVRTGDGKLVMNASYENKAGERVWGLFFSDDGRKWTQPIPSTLGRITLVSLGGSRLLSLGSSLRFSEDGGKSWSAPEAVPPVPDGRTINTDVPYSRVVDGQTMTIVGDVSEPAYERWQDSKEIWTRGILRRYHLDTHTWDEPYLFPREWGLCEGSIVRAKNGNLVAAFRTQMMDGTHITTDHWMGLATTRSTDNGKTWEKPVRAWEYGHMHTNLLRLPDGRILLTYAARIGEIDGLPYHGIEAVISRDNGKTWDWPRRYVLFRWMKNQTMHSPSSVLLPDGSILTTFQHDSTYSWDDGSVGPAISQKMIGNVSAVIWKP